MNPSSLKTYRKDPKELPIIFDGHAYDTVEDIPDMGSLVGEASGVSGKKRTYYGLFSDFDKLPHYDDLETGSDAQLVDEDAGLVYCYYEKSTDTWTVC